ncbi:hypothetical protein [Nocardioides pakistanensis]
MAAGEHSCPACGETERLRGQRDGDQIKVTCEACGHSWVRGQLTCRTCGGHDIVHRPQPMSRTPRGNQVAIVGWREVALCRSCDAEVAAESLGKNRPVPENYVPKATLNPATVTPTRPPEGSKKPQPGAPPPPRTTNRPARTSNTPATPPPRSPKQEPARKPADPTARQAIEAYLTAAGADADSLTMLMLGSHLGPASRLSDLGRDGAPDALRRWFDGTWPSSNPRRAAALASVRAALGHWADQGWITTDTWSALSAALGE